ncbi:hypothetical protein MMC13_002153 [Lambiella insularis]|nr:hypothetical protein [Lambiella insularis]
MESAGLRSRNRIARNKPVMDNLSPTGMEPARYTIDLSLQPRDRFKQLALVYKAELLSLPVLFDAIIQAMHPNINSHFLQRAAMLLLRRVHNSEETAELQGISEVTGIKMHLLVAFNVLLDLFMGCTSGGVGIKDDLGHTRMVHFRTLDWGMDALRKIVVHLDFVNHASGPVIASTVTYVGYVGVLTGVREGLSLSLNFRPTHDSSTRLIDYRFYFHQALVLLGIRPSISSLLRTTLLPRRSDSEKRLPLPTLETLERDLPIMKTTATYLIFSDGKRTITMEKDHRTAVVKSAEGFIVALNHDVDSEAQRHHGETQADFENHQLAMMGMEGILEESIDRKACILGLWRKASRRSDLGISRSLKNDRVTLRDVCRWMDVHNISNDQTHFAVIMDPEAGKILWIKHYPEPREMPA